MDRHSTATENVTGHNDASEQLARSLNYQCQDGSLVNHPRDCKNNNDINIGLPELTLVNSLDRHKV